MAAETWLNFQVDLRIGLSCFNPGLPHRTKAEALTDPQRQRLTLPNESLRARRSGKGYRYPSRANHVQAMVPHWIEKRRATIEMRPTE